MTLNAIVLQFLLAIAGVESNHGTMMAHPEVIRGPQAGFTALGRFGIMPNTILTMSRSPASITAFKEDPKIELKFAERYAVVVLQAAKGCVLTGSILWQRGPAGRPIKADYQSPRFKRFIYEWEKQSGVPIERDEVIGRYCK